MQNTHPAPTTNSPKPETAPHPSGSYIGTTEPGTLQVIKRNGTLVPYDGDKIKIAMTKAFLAIEGNQAAASSRVHDTVAQLTQQITDNFNRRFPTGHVLHIEDIQDQAELALMRHGSHQVARSYVLYREEHRKARQAKEATAAKKSTPTLHVTQHDGSRVPLDSQWVEQVVSDACAGLSDVDHQHIAKDAVKNLFDGVNIDDVDKALIMTARTFIESEPNYSFVTARLLLNSLRSEVLRFLKLGDHVSQSDMTNLYPEYFKHFIEHGLKQGILTPELKTFDLDVLAQALLPERDLQFTYLSLQTLYDRYFLHEEETRYELPQAFFMRVAMGLALSEENKEERAIEFYRLLSSFDYMAATPTLFNSGTVRPQLSSCFLTSVPDDLGGIYNAIRDNALLSKFAGGLGNDWTPVRAMGAHIKGTNGKSLGVVPFMNVANATAIAVNQGGKRKGAVCGYLETWHMDIEEFLELRKNTGDERRRTHDMHTANWIPDLFMKRVFDNKDWTLFSPDEVPELHDCYGLDFEKAYVAYEEKAKAGTIKNYKSLPAVNLWRKMLSMLFETGHAWMTFKDTCNLRSPQQHAGVIHSSNLCTEITLNTSKDEVAVCNLGSINLVAHLDREKGTVDLAKLKRTVQTAVRMLDNVIDINYYTIPQAKNANMKHRPVGMGLMGFQDALYELDIDYASDKAVTFADHTMEAISYFAFEASSDLAKERGPYASYDGSLWSRGILPIDSIRLLKESRQQYLEQDTSQSGLVDWQALRDKIKESGIRNSNVLAIAPTATISNICGVTQSIEPTYQNLFVKSNMSGEFTVINPALVKALKARNLWDNVMVNDLKYYNGSVSQIDRIPDDIKARFATAFEIDPKWLVEAASRRQKWIDQSQSLNLYMAEPSGKKLDKLYKMAWLRGLKTCYYMRSLGATNTEKSTINDGALNAVQVEPSSTTQITTTSCSLDDEHCEACQ